MDYEHEEWVISRKSCGDLGVDGQVIDSFKKCLNPLLSTTDPEDHFRVTLWAPVTITDLNIKWLKNPFPWQFHLSNKKNAEGTTICMLLTPPKSELHSWKEKLGSKL